MSSIRFCRSNALRFCDPHSFFSALSKRKNAPRRCKKEKTLPGGFVPRRPPDPLLCRKVPAVTLGNCRAIIRMGSSKAGPLALGWHGSEVGDDGLIVVCRGRRSRSQTSLLPALAANAPPARLLNASRLDVPRADEDIGPCIHAGGGQKDRGNPPCRICHSRAGFAFGPPMARLRKNRAAFFRPRRRQPAFPSLRSSMTAEAVSPLQKPRPRMRPAAPGGFHDDSVVRHRSSRTRTTPLMARILSAMASSRTWSVSKMV